MSLFHWSERALWRRAGADPQSPLHRSARTLEELQRPVTRARTAAFGFSAACLLGAAVAGPRASGILMGLGLAGAAVCALLERHVFFTTVVPFRMPGGV